jgi:hypothetical protein
MRMITIIRATTPPWPFRSPSPDEGVLSLGLAAGGTGDPGTDPEACPAPTAPPARFPGAAGAPGTADAACPRADAEPAVADGDAEAAEAAEVAAAEGAAGWAGRVTCFIPCPLAPLPSVGASENGSFTSSRPPEAPAPLAPAPSEPGFSDETGSEGSLNSPSERASSASGLTTGAPQ